VDLELAKREAYELIDAWLRGKATSQEVAAWASQKFIDDASNSTIRISGTPFIQ
jgi:hypothetical protein